jgi:hypothetical protein
MNRSPRPAAAAGSPGGVAARRPSCWCRRRAELGTGKRTEAGEQKGREAKGREGTGRDGKHLAAATEAAAAEAAAAEAAAAEAPHHAAAHAAVVSIPAVIPLARGGVLSCPSTNTPPVLNLKRLAAAIDSEPHFFAVIDCDSPALQVVSDTVCFVELPILSELVPVVDQPLNFFNAYQAFRR